MATIIIQGTKDETSKALSALKTHFNVINKKASTVTENGAMTVIDAWANADNVGEHTPEEIMNSLACCSNRERNCAACSYKREENCREKLNTDAAIYVNRLFREKEKNDDARD